MGFLFPVVIGITDGGMFFKPKIAVPLSIYYNFNLLFQNVLIVFGL